MSIVEDFRKLTSITNPASNTCCRKVNKQGAPYCCSSLVDNTYHLTFTEEELEILGYHILEMQGIELSLSRVWGYYESRCDNPKKMEKSLKDGILADTLECASHPTRPIIQNGVLVGVATVKDCIAEYALHEMAEDTYKYYKLWKRAIKLTGIKPYYLTGEFAYNKYQVL